MKHHASTRFCFWQRRALGVPVPDGVQWFWIGAHADYDRLLA